jgi:ribose/xylose/arabinose/galactoside ABC-type transport system permease subunit
MTVKGAPRIDKKITGHSSMKKIAFFLTLIVLSTAAGALQFVPAAQAVPEAHQAEEKPDIAWFRKEMGIAPQYLEEEEGVFGMSWAHFILMVFLIVFFFGALIAYYRQTTRTTRILQQLLSKEE